ncbi:hypothetical protein IB642_07830 [Allofrancisella guangzhouensis]|uniref:Uncharacterized protein n=1 Tax=Allofrancisella guangzhouensis TaxID=594679 RepID=A0A0A8E7V0_9GAMM|nr:hypothetical protein [Allofrancisella guangzhouensis]AJC48231.1 hypothetical protein SD28_00405 [Allofrancisella guangzhouensis]MBK2028024.1 hypothetical protein [Allofrancisella guangzhouensis]MBK2044921.1 hypothetical protein [Allofrancisella guangzhouensis]MBK2046445.1 hypothetical protein [Allofrancisella guangzhouensis]
MKKLLLATILAIPAMGYCGLIDWLTGYPEVREKLSQRLTEKYNSDKFEILELTYSDNLKGYNFKAKDITKDITGSGSYFPESGVIAANVFKKEMLKRDLERILKPYISQVSDNYNFVAGFGSVTPVEMSAKETMKIVDSTLDYMYEDGVDASKLIADKKGLVRIGIGLSIQSKQDPESIYKVLKMVYEVNKYFQEHDVGEYTLNIETFDVPDKFNISEWLKLQREYQRSGFSIADKYQDEELYKYAWGYLNIKSCRDSLLDWDKTCNIKYRTEKKKELVKVDKSTLKADKIHSIQDVAKYFEIYDNYGQPTVERITGQSGRKYVNEYWQAKNGRKVTPLDKTKYYPAVEKIISENK